MGAGEIGSDREALWQGGGRSDESAPDDDSPEVYAAGQGHDRCYRMHMLDQINALVAVADAGEGGGAGSMGSWGSGGVSTDEMNLCRS